MEHNAIASRISNDLTCDRVTEEHIAIASQHVSGEQMITVTLPGSMINKKHQFILVPRHGMDSVQSLDKPPPQCRSAASSS